jgi:hypothetical protein
MKPDNEITALTFCAVTCNEMARVWSRDYRFSSFVPVIGIQFVRKVEKGNLIKPSPRLEKMNGNES